jgi:hypothetical protein
MPTCSMHSLRSRSCSAIAPRSPATMRRLAARNRVSNSLAWAQRRIPLASGLGSQPQSSSYRAGVTLFRPAVLLRKVTKVAGGDKSNLRSNLRSLRGSRCTRGRERGKSSTSCPRLPSCRPPTGARRWRGFAPGRLGRTGGQPGWPARPAAACGGSQTRTAASCAAVGGRLLGWLAISLLES